MLYVLGIDPGKKGAFSVVSKSRIRELDKMPLTSANGNIDPVEVCNLLRGYLKKYPKLKAVIEYQQARPIQGAKASFNLGFQYGVLETALMLLEIPHVSIRPQEWQKVMFSGLAKSEKSDTKGASILACRS